MSIFHFFLPLLSERENYKRFTTSLLRRVGKAYTQSFNLDLGSFHTIASEAEMERVRRTIVFQSREIQEVFYISNLSETILYAESQKAKTFRIARFLSQKLSG